MYLYSLLASVLNALLTGTKRICFETHQKMRHKEPSPKLVGSPVSSLELPLWLT